MNDTHEDEFLRRLTKQSYKTATARVNAQQAKAQQAQALAGAASASPLSQLGAYGVHTPPQTPKDRLGAFSTVDLVFELMERGYSVFKITEFDKR